MRITLTETGGWANIGRTCTLDTARMPKSEARSLEAAVQELARAPAAQGSQARDARTVTIRVVSGDHQETLSFSEAEMPPQAAPVLKILRPLCVPIPNRRA